MTVSPTANRPVVHQHVQPLWPAPEVARVREGGKAAGHHAPPAVGSCSGGGGSVPNVGGSGSGSSEQRERWGRQCGSIGKPGRRAEADVRMW